MVQIVEAVGAVAVEAELTVRETFTIPEKKELNYLNLGGNIRIAVTGLFQRDHASFFVLFVHITGLFINGKIKHFFFIQ